MALSKDEKERLEELRASESLNQEEKAELADLESREPADPAQDEFDSAWDDDNFDPDAQTDNDDDEGNDDQEDKDKTQDQPDEDDDDPNADLDDTGNPDDESDSSATGGDEDDAGEETPEATIAKLQADLAKEKQVSASWRGRVEKLTAEQKLKKDNKSGQGKSDEDLPENEDDPELRDFFQEYPDLKSPFMKIVKKEVDKAVSSVREEVGEVRGRQNEDETAKHFNAIEEAHPDCYDIRDSGKLEEWIESKPGYLRPRLYEVFEKGNTQDVIEMFDSFKDDTGKGKSKPNPKPKPSRKTLKERKRKTMEAVPASSAGARKPKGKPDKDDFDGGWDYFNEKDEKK